MLGLPLFIYLPNFYHQNLGLSLSAVGLVLLFARSLDVITDPIIGFINDRYPKSKQLEWRRKSFMLAGIPLLLIGLNFLLKPEGEITAAYLLLWSFVTYLGWTLINIPWLAIGAELSKRYHEKSTLASSREIFSVIGTITVITIPVLLSLSSDLKATLHLLAQSSTIIARSIQNRPISVIKLFTKENIQLLKHPAIRKILPAYFINSVANALPATLFIMYVTYVLQIPDLVGILLISYFVAAIVGVPFWLYLARKTDKHSSWRYALYGSIASFIWVPLIGPNDFIPFLMICIASGFFLGADVVMPSSIQADISQKITLENSGKNNSNDNGLYEDTSNNSTALIFGIWGMLTKLSLALAIGIAFPLLDLAGLEINNTTAVSPNTYASSILILLYAVIPIILKIYVLILIRHFDYGYDYFVNHALSSKLKNKNTQQGKTNENTQTEIINRPISLSSTYERLQ